MSEAVKKNYDLAKPLVDASDSVYKAIEAIPHEQRPAFVLLIERDNAIHICACGGGADYENLFRSAIEHEAILLTVMQRALAGYIADRVVASIESKDATKN